MYDDIDNDRDFWREEPTRRIPRLPTRMVSPRTGEISRTGARTRQHINVITTPARPSRRPVDPFLVRLALIACVGIALLPVAYSLGHDGSDVLRTAPTGGAAALPVADRSSATTVPVTAPAVLDAATVAPSTVPVTAPASDPAASSSPPTTAFDIDALPPAVPVNDVDAQVEAAVVTTAPPARKSKPAATTPATSAVTAPQTTAKSEPHREAPAGAPVCSATYRVANGDYWIAIANKVHVALKDLLAANNATARSPLYPGHDICLPKGASSPATTAVTTAPAHNAPVTTKAPATTAAPTTTLPRRTYTSDEVEAIIREVWPDDLEDEAIRIARRESNLQPTAHNSCCYGLFQIYWSVHKGWLSAMGITSAQQLMDPRIGATAGYALYQRSGGWGPWAI